MNIGPRNYICYICPPSIKIESVAPFVDGSVRCFFTSPSIHFFIRVHSSSVSDESLIEVISSYLELLILSCYRSMGTTLYRIGLLCSICNRIFCSAQVVCCCCRHLILETYLIPLLLYVTKYIRYILYCMSPQPQAQNLILLLLSSNI